MKASIATLVAVLATLGTLQCWFEYAPGDADLFEDLVQMRRATEEWTFVDREVDVRLLLE